MFVSVKYYRQSYQGFIFFIIIIKAGININALYTGADPFDGRKESEIPTEVTEAVVKDDVDNFYPVSNINVENMPF